MTQEHQLPTRIQVDCYIAQAKVLRTRAIASLAKRLFRLPSSVTGNLASWIKMKKPVRSMAGEKVL